MTLNVHKSKKKMYGATGVQLSDFVLGKPNKNSSVTTRENNSLRYELRIYALFSYDNNIA